MPHTAIMAATVLFTGLICHVTVDSTTKEAVLVDGGSHKPTLSVPVGSFKSESGTWHKKITGGDWEYDISGDRLIIAGGSGSLTANSKFNDHVPHLQDIIATTDTIHNDLTLGKHHNSLALLKYMHGELGVASCYTGDNSEIRFDPPTNKDPRCLGQLISLDFLAGGDWEIQDATDATRKIVIAAGAIVTVANTTGAGGQHYKMYSKVLANSNTVVNDMKFTGRVCNQSCQGMAPQPAVNSKKSRVVGKHGGFVSRHGSTVECSNTQWP